ncbi:MAG: acyl-homoserine-lactone synthase [Sphingomonas sp.]
MAQLLSTNIHSREDDALKAMFAARKRVFIDLLKWDIPALDGKYEIDGFDNEHAEYLILTDRDGGHMASARLLPTTRPHLLDTLFPELCEGGAPVGEATFEITRFCLDRNLSAAERRVARNQLVTALVGHALANGIKRYTGVAEIAWLQQILRFGWDCRPLGTPFRHPSGMIGGLDIRITSETPALLEAAGIWNAAPTPMLPERRAVGANG